MKRSRPVLLLCLGLYSSGARPAEPPTAPPRTAPATPPPADAPKPVTPPAEAAKPIDADAEDDLPPGEKGSADNNVSFPVDI